MGSGNEERRWTHGKPGDLESTQAYTGENQGTFPTQGGTSIAIAATTTISSVAVSSTSVATVTSSSSPLLATSVPSSVFTSTTQIPSTPPGAVTGAGETSPQTELSSSQSSNVISTPILAAAIVIPVVIALLIAAFILMRRRKTKRPSSLKPGMQQRRNNAFVPPMLLGANTTYYTGLDTDSAHETGSEYYAAGRSDASSFSEPPPPYKAKTHLPSANEAQPAGSPIARVPSGMPQNPPSRDSWATAPHGTGYVDSSSGLSPTPAGSRSINSDAYSENASVRSARAARLSVGPTVVSRLDLTHTEHDPFEDPGSPVSSVWDEEARSLEAPSRSVSPVSLR